MLTSRLSLGKRIVLLVVAGLAVVLAIFGFLCLRALRESSDRALNERLIAAQLTARHIDSLLKIQLDILHQSAGPRDLDLEDPDPDPKQVLLEHLDNLGGGTGHGVFLLDRNGRLVWAEPPAERDGFNDRTVGDVAREVIATGKPRVSDGYSDPAGRMLVSLGAPVMGRDGNPSGALVRVLDLTEPLLSGFVDPVSLGRTGYAEIVDHNGLVLASSKASRLFQKSDHTDQFAAMIQAGRPTAGTCHSCHEAGGDNQVEPEVLAFAPLSVAPWGVAIRQSEAEALALPRELQRDLSIAALTSLLAMAVTVLLCTRGVVSPIRGLTAVSRRMAAGDLDSRVESRGPAEVRELARAFDEMRERLRDSYRNLERVNSSLELRVDQRTRQLSALLQISKVLASTLDLRPLLDAVVASIGEVLGLADAGLVALYNERSERLEAVASWGYGSAVRQLSVEPGEGIIGQVFQSGKPVLLDTTEAIQKARSSFGAKNRAWLSQAMEGLGLAIHLIVVPLAVKGRVIGSMALAHHCREQAFTQHDLQLAQALADQIAVAVENARLYREVLEKEALRGQLLDKVIVAQEEERRRIARELHDGTCQALASLAISLGEMEESLPAHAPKTRSYVRHLRVRVRSTLAEVRTLALNLRPSVLDDLGLTMAIDWYAREQLAMHGVEVRLETDCDGVMLPPSLETVLFRIAQEALNNVVKHSGAATVVLRLAVHDSKVILEVEDDGLGFNVDRALRPAAPVRTFGLHGMIERATLSAGILQVISTPGHGTKIRAELPLSEERANEGEKDYCLAGG